MSHFNALDITDECCSEEVISFFDAQCIKGYKRIHTQVDPWGQMVIGGSNLIPDLCTTLLQKSHLQIKIFKTVTFIMAT